MFGIHRAAWFSNVTVPDHYLQSPMKHGLLGPRSTNCNPAGLGQAREAQVLEAPRWWEGRSLGLNSQSSGENDKGHVDDKRLYLPPQPQQHTNSTCFLGAHAHVCVHVCERETEGGTGGWWRGGRLLYLTGDPHKIFWKRKICSSIRYWKSLTLTHPFILLKGKWSSSEMTCCTSHSPKHNQLLSYNSIKVWKCSSNE